MSPVEKFQRAWRLYKSEDGRETVLAVGFVLTAAAPVVLSYLEARRDE